MTTDAGGWWMLGFTYDAVVDAWQDARLADAVERAWRAAACPGAVEVYWVASADEFAFRWYLNAAAADMLDRASVAWRGFLVGPVAGPPGGAHRFLPVEAEG